LQLDEEIKKKIAMDKKKIKLFKTALKEERATREKIEKDL
jgi:hypothetical protein